jgi:hypothetical protein
MVTDTINLGMNLGLGIDPQGAGGATTTNYDILLAPAMRYYLTTSGVVAPFIHAQANLRFYDDHVDTKHIGLGAAGGIGVEWFPVRNFSVGGQTGLGLDIVRPDPGKPVKLATFTSALTAQIYWE